MNKNIVFRVDSSIDIGAGHAMRCIALAEEFIKQGDKIIFISKYHLSFVIKKIKQLNITVKKLKANNCELEIRKIVGIVKNNDINFIILDGYNYDYGYQRKIKENNIRVIYITDYPGKHAADILICPTPGLNKRMFISNIKTRYFLGPQYIFLRDEILNFKKTKTERGNKIVINFGGSYCNIALIKKFIIAIEKCIVNGLIRIITGSNKLNERILDLTLKLKNQYQFISANKFNIKTLADNDFVVSSASTTLWELAYLGLPIICFYISDNQKSNAEWLENKAYALNIGNINKATDKKIVHLIAEIQNNDKKYLIVVDKLKKIINGNGKRLIADEIISIRK